MGMSAWPHVASVTAVISAIFSFLEGDFYYGHSVAVLPFVLCACVREREHTWSFGFSITFLFIHRTLNKEMPHPWGFLGGLVAKTPCSQYRGPGFDHIPQ